MMKTGLATTDFWDSQNSAYKLQVIDDTDPIISFMGMLNFSAINSCFEVGCFPGGYLAYLGKQGLEVNGIDFSNRVLSELLPFYKNNGFRVGLFLEGDFFKMDIQKTFDLVCSFGFIEHFENWKEVMDLHSKLLTSGGYLVITTPNFRGKWQNLIHKYLDKKNYNRHYIPAMQPTLWKLYLEQNGFTVLKSGFFGKFDFWIEEEPPLYFKPAIVLLRRLKPLLKKILSDNNEAYSPYCGIIARKK